MNDYSHLLAESQVTSLQNKGVSAQAINAETLAATALTGYDIWVEVKMGMYQVLLFSLEMYLSEGEVVNKFPIRLLVQQVEATLLTSHYFGFLADNFLDKPNCPLFDFPPSH